VVNSSDLWSGSRWF